MRISDWSSDVCSSDLRLLKQEVEQQKILEGIQLSTSVITILQGDPSRLIRWEIRDANGNSMDGNGNIPLPENWTYEEDRIRFRNETRSEEHTSELQSLMRTSYAVFCLKNKTTKHTQ